MLINEETLIQLKAEKKLYKKKDMIFQEGAQPKYYYQILTGNVSLINYHQDGKEFIQNFFNEGDSIHESSLFDGLKYSVNAVADSDCTIYRIDKDVFIKLIDDDLKIKDLMYANSAKAIRFLMTKNIVFKSPMTKLEHIINLLKIPIIDSKYTFIVPFTRQQLLL